jgi:gamma-glutamyl-gamma-aminobutyrate hydrolase PuuD
MAAPLIGLTTYREPAAWGVWQQPADLLPVTYSAEVVAAGGVPVLLPPARVDDVAAGRALDALAGLIVPGGADVDPARYGAAADPRTTTPRTDRDEWELLLVRAALDRRMPILAICRGMQLLNVALGGTLVQHLPDLVGGDDHCPTPGVHGRHDVRLDPDTRIGGLLGRSATVATYHHQAVADLGSGLLATGWADDGVVEALELEDGWAVGVQWHPEVHDGARLFAGFLSACRSGDRE